MPGEVRGDVSAHEHAMEMTVQEIVQELIDLLGATTVAVIGGVKETRAVTQWVSESGRLPQRPHVLRFALQLATMISSHADREIARAWFHGSNPHLNDQIPMLMLRNGKLSDIQGDLLSAARAFAARPEKLT
jgi:hypothetical protein